MTLHSLMCFRSKCKCMQKHFPMRMSTQSYVLWSGNTCLILACKSHITTVKVSHVISFLSPPISFVWFIFLWKWYCQIAALLSNLHIFIHVLSKNRSAQTEHIWGWDTGKGKNTGCCCQERSELIVWMFWNYIHFLFVHSAHLTPPQSTEPGDHATFVVCGVKVS